MEKASRGFTMIELLVVMLIILVIAVLALPQFKKAAESSRADQAISTLQMIASTNRLYFLDHSQFASGSLQACAARGPCNCNPGDASSNCGNPCTLIWCGYLTQQNFAQQPYVFSALNATVNTANPCGLGVSGAPSAHYTACAKRNGGSGVYANWGYTVLSDGTIQGWPTSNGPPPAPPSS